MNGPINGPLAAAAMAMSTAIVVQLDDGTNVTASLGNGYWRLTWWPLVAAAKRVVALDATGAEVASLAVENP